MGMFDSVWAECPKCHRQVEFQSKAGNCLLEDYTLDKVPLIIADDLVGKSRHCECGAVCTIGPHIAETVRVPMYTTYPLTFKG